MENIENFFISKKEKGEYIIYSSEAYFLTEIEILNLIKICIVEGRNRGLGRKILSIYKDSTKEREELTNKRLNLIGIFILLRMEYFEMILLQLY
jgi:hypothetical protein